MTKARRAEIVMKELNRLYPHPRIPLKHKDPFTFLVAVMLSAQCTDRRVNEVSPRLFAVADTPQKMAACPREKIEEIIRPCGLAPSKSANIKKQPAFPVDTHIHRLAKRWGLSSGKSVEQTEADLKKIFPQEAWGNLHLQFIYYGREHCKAHTCKTPQTRCAMCKMLAK